MELLPAVANWFFPLIGRGVYNAKAVEEASKTTKLTTSMLEEHLSGKTWLVDEQLSLADLYVAGILSRGFQYLFDIDWRRDHPSITKWYVGVHEVPCYAAIVGEMALIDKAVEYQPPA